MGNHERHPATDWGKGMKKIVINACFGGFGVSEAGMRRYAEIKGINLYVEPDLRFPSLGEPTYWIVPKSERPASIENEWHERTMEERQIYNDAYSKCTIYPRDIPRDDAALVQVVEEMGEKSSSRFADLKVVEIPDDVDWEISEYDGNEHVAEAHRAWS